MENDEGQFMFDAIQQHKNQYPKLGGICTEEITDLRATFNFNGSMHRRILCMNYS